MLPIIKPWSSCVKKLLTMLLAFSFLTVHNLQQIQAITGPHHLIWGESLLLFCFYSNPLIVFSFKLSFSKSQITPDSKIFHVVSLVSNIYAPGLNPWVNAKKNAFGVLNFNFWRNIFPGVAFDFFTGSVNYHSFGWRVPLCCYKSGWWKDCPSGRYATLYSQPRFNSVF